MFSLLCENEKRLSELEIQNKNLLNIKTLINYSINQLNINPSFLIYQKDTLAKWISEATLSLFITFASFFSQKTFLAHF